MATKAYNAAIATMGSGTDAEVKKRLASAARTLDDQHAETRRTANIQTQENITTGTQVLAGQGLAGSQYGPYKSGEQERIVKAQNGYLDLTNQSLAASDKTALVSYGRALIDEKNRRSYANRATKTTTTQQAVGSKKELVKAALATNDDYLAPGARVTAKTSGTTGRNQNRVALNESLALKAQTSQKTPDRATQVAYDSLTDYLTDSGQLGLFRAQNQTGSRFMATQNAIYNNVEAINGKTAADSLFGVNAMQLRQKSQRGDIAQQLIKRQEWRSRPMDAETAKAKTEQIDAQITEKSTLLNELSARTQFMQPGEEYQNAVNQIIQYKTEIATLERMRSNIAERKNETIYSEWMKLEDAEDFETLSKPTLDIEDEFYRGINDLDGAEEKYKAGEDLRRSYSDAYLYALEESKNLSEDELALLNYIYATKGGEEAGKYLGDISFVRNARWTQRQQQGLEDFANAEPIFASAYATAMGFTKALGLAYSIGAGVAGEEIDPNSPFFYGSLAQQTIIGTVAYQIANDISRMGKYSTFRLQRMGYNDAEIQEIQNGTRRDEAAEVVGAGVAFLYETGMSIADFLLVAQTGGPAALTIMGTGAAADTVLSAKQRGASNAQALALGTIAGIAEVVFEKFSLDRFYKMTVSAKHAVVKNTLAQMGIEATEELATEFTNILADIAIMGENSNTRLRINAYQEAGLSYEQAHKEAAIDNLEQIGMAALGGAISGGVIGTGTSLALQHNVVLNGASIIEGAKNGHLDLTNEVVAEGLRGNKRQQELANSIKAAQAAGKAVNALDLGQLHAANENAFRKGMIDIALMEMQENGESKEDIQHAKKVMEKLLAGEQISTADRAFITGNESIRRSFGIETYKMNETNTIETESLKTTQNGDNVTTGGVQNGKQTNDIRNESEGRRSAEQAANGQIGGAVAGTQKESGSNAQTDERTVGSREALRGTRVSRRSVSKVKPAFSQLTQEEHTKSIETTRRENTASVDRFLKDYNSKITTAKSDKPLIEQGDISISEETDEQTIKSMYALTAITGQPVYLYTSKQGRTDIPHGFSDEKRSYALYTPENTSRMIVNAAHEMAHNMSDIIAAGTDLEHSMPGEILDAYVASRTGDLEEKTRSEYRTEFICDMFGAVMQEVITGDPEASDTIYDSLGVSADTAARFEAAFMNALEGTSVEEEALDQAAQENVSRTYGGEDETIRLSENDFGREKRRNEAYEVFEKEGVYRDAIGRLTSDGSISQTGGAYGKGGYLIFTTTALNKDSGKKWENTPEGIEQIKAWAKENGFKLEEGKDGYNAFKANLVHKKTQDQIDKAKKSDEKIFKNVEKGFIRFGELPESGYSANRGSEFAEKGISVFDAEFSESGEWRPIFKTEQEKMSYLTLIADERAVYRVWGDVVGRGGDGEPLLKNATAVRARQNIRYSENNIETNGDINNEDFFDEAMHLYKSGVGYLEYVNRKGHDNAVARALRNLWDTKRNVRIMRTALDLYTNTVSPEQYWRDNKENFDGEKHQVQLQLIGMYLRNDIDMGGRIGEKRFESIVGVTQRAPQYSAARLAFTSPARVFENSGASRKEDSMEARALNFVDGERMRDTFIGMLINQNASRNSYMQAWGTRVEKAYEGGTIRESALAQLIGEGIINQKNAEEAIFDRKHMLVQAFDGWFVFDGKGSLIAFCDGETTFAKGARFEAIEDALGKFEHNKTTSQKLRERVNKKFQRIDGTIAVRKTGSNAEIKIPGIKNTITIRNGKAPNLEVAIRTAAELKEFYKQAWEAQTSVLVQNGYRPAGYVEDYFPHFWGEQTGVNAAIKQFISYDLPTAISGETSVYKPGKPWASHLLKRNGEVTEYDAVRGFNKYVKTASDVVYMTPAIQRLRQLESYVRKNPGADETTNSALAAWLREYTNGIANKKSGFDRGTEDMFGREAYSFSDTLTMLISRSAVQGNVSSALSNIISYVSSMPTLDPRFAAIGTKDALLQTLYAMSGSKNYDGFVEKIPFLQARFGSYETILTSQWQKALRVGDKALGILFAATDRFSVEAVARAKYAELRNKGYAEEDAIRQTDAYCLKLFADRSKGMAPTAFNSKVMKPFTQFQLEVLNQTSHFRDIHRQGTGEMLESALEQNDGDLQTALTKMETEIQADGAENEWIRKLVYLVLLSLWGGLTRELMGRDQTWNPYGMAKDFMEDAKTDGVGQAVLNAGGSVIEQLPGTSFLTGGRIPIMSGVSKLSTFAEEVTNGIIGKGWNWDSIGESALLAALAFTPGGGQVKKSIEAARIIKEDGAFKTNNKGEKQLQFEAPKTTGDKAKALVFGKWASEQAQDYIKSPDLLTPKQTKGYVEAKKAGIDGLDYMRMRLAFKDIEPIKDEEGNITKSAADQKREMLMKRDDLTMEQKSLIDKYLISPDGSEPLDYSSDALLKLSMQSKVAYQNALGLQNNGITPEKYLEYLDIYEEYETIQQDAQERGTELKYQSGKSGNEVNWIDGTLEPNEGVRQAIWQDETLSERQKYLLESKITGSNTWTDKAAQAAKSGIAEDEFYKYASYYRDYEGSDTASGALWSELRNGNVTAKEAIEMQAVITGSKTDSEKATAIMEKGIAEKYAYKYVAQYRDIKNSDDDNPLGYGDQLTMKLAIASEKALTSDKRMELTDSLLGTTLVADAAAAKKEAGVPEQSYYAFYSKYWTLNAKDENGKTVNGLKKQRTKELLASIGLTLEQQQYLLFSTGSYTKW